MATIPVDYDSNNDGLVEYGDPQGRTAGEEKIIIAEINDYLEANPKLKKNAKKIIIIAGDSENSKVGGVTVAGGKYAWIYTNNVNSAIIKVIPHEYGHMKFGNTREAWFLDNPFKDGSDSDPTGQDKRCDDDNLMNNGGTNMATKLRCWQWEKINQINN